MDQILIFFWIKQVYYLKEGLELKKLKESHGCEIDFVGLNN
jgi:hypothetical protein